MEPNQSDRSSQPSGQSYSEYVVPEEPASGQEANGSSQEPGSRHRRSQHILEHAKAAVTNPYVWGLLLLLAASGGLVAFVQHQSDETVEIDGDDFAASSIGESDFAALAEEQAEIDTTNKTLEIQANSVFDGTMLVRSSLDVQGKLRVGEALTLNDVAVSGQATLNNADISEDLNVDGNTQLNGTATVQNTLTVNDDVNVVGGGNFGEAISTPSIEAGNLSFSGNLDMSGRIRTGGAQTTASAGTSVGNGGTVSVNGNDTAGNVNINTGSSPASGILARVQFGDGYSTTPRVILSPIGNDTGNLDWYVTRTDSGFRIGASTPPDAGSNYSFDYFIVE